MAGGNGFGGFGSARELYHYHASRLAPKGPSNLPYKFGARWASNPTKDNPMPMDGEQTFSEDEFRRAQAIDQLQQQTMEDYKSMTEPPSFLPPVQAPAPQAAQPQPTQKKKSLKEIAMEQGTIPRRSQ